MKYIITLCLLFISINIVAQKPCDYSANVTDSLGTYKSTKEYMISERNFAGNTNNIFCSLSLSDGLPALIIQHIQKSREFIKAHCFDKNSKLFLQLNNGKIITLIHIEQENCGTMIRGENGLDSRLNSGIFLFPKESFEELKKSPVSLMRIKYLTDTEDYVLKKEFKSELNNETYYPEDYFMNYLKCIE